LIPSSSPRRTLPSTGSVPITSRILAHPLHLRHWPTLPSASLVPSHVTPSFALSISIPRRTLPSAGLAVTAVRFQSRWSDHLVRNRVLLGFLIAFIL
jgi:hypothetical protein